jgi:tetratricopeptide (TPR) repeat protein
MQRPGFTGALFLGLANQDPDMRQIDPVTMRGSTWSTAAWFCLLTAFVTIVYAPGLSGPFVFDDYNNIVQNSSLAAGIGDVADLRQILLSGFAGPLKRPLAMLSFALNIEATGLNPFFFKLTNLIVHLVNGLLVFAAARALLRIRNRLFDEFHDASMCALVTAAVWLVHPTQLTSVLYVVQRMTSLSATFLFAGLWLYLDSRARIIDGRPYIWRLWFGVPLLALLAGLAKENGVLLLLYALVIEACVFQFRSTDRANLGSLRQFHLVLVAVPMMFALAYLAWKTDWSGAASVTRPFNALERLLTESRVMFLYLRILVLPTLPDLALFYDDFTVSRSLLDPPSTLVAVIGLGALLIGALVYRRRTPWFSFAVLWFLAGHLIESTVILLELVHVHRNYVAYLGPILAAVVASSRLCEAKHARFAQAAALCIIAVIGLATAQRAQQWSDPFALAFYEVHHRPNSARANYELGRLFFLADRVHADPQHRVQARAYFERAIKLDPYSISAPVALLILAGGPNHVPRDPALAELGARLARRPMLGTEVHYLRSLVECQQKENCRRPPGEMLEIFGHALSHPELRPGLKADVLAIMGLYYANTLNDLAACIRTMEESAQTMPMDPNYRLNLAQAYMVARRLKAAAMSLTQAEKLDALGAYASRIKRLKADLDKLVAAEDDGSDTPN